MKALMRWCVPAVLGVGALVGAAPAAKAVGPEAPAVLAASYDVHVAGPFATYAAARLYADYLEDTYGYDTRVVYQYGAWWVLYA